MLTNIRLFCEEIANEFGITPIKKDIELCEFTKLRDVLKIKNCNQHNLICVGSRPGMGKTAFALDIVLDTAISTDKNVLVFSAESSAKQIATRLIQKLTGINIYKFKNSMIDEEYKNKLSSAIAFLQELNILIDDTANVSPSYIEECLSACKNPGLVVADYIQLMRMENANESRSGELSEISRGLAVLPRMFCVPIIVFTQLSRILREDKRPRLTDMRSIGTLEMDSDIILFIHRKSFCEDDPINDHAEIIISKNRYGECGTINMHFDCNTISFKESEKYI